MRPSIRLLFLLFIAFASQGLTQELPGRLNVWMNAEQNLNDKNGFNIPTRDHSALQKQFQAVSGSWFQVKSYWIPESELDVASIVDQVSPELKDSLIKVIDGISHYRLFVHPESESFYDSLTKKYPAAESALARATASSRTVLMTTENGDFFFAKLSLNVELGRVVRTIPKAETVQSIGLSQYILNKKNQIDSGFHFIPETLGIIPKGWARGGQIIRPIPKEVLSGEKTIVPLFALTAPQKNGTLLAQMIQQSGDNPYQFVRHQILKPFVKSWVQWAIHGALSMEAHSQNVLLEISKKGFKI